MRLGATVFTPNMEGRALRAAGYSSLPAQSRESLYVKVAV